MPKFFYFFFFLFCAVTVSAQKVKNVCGEYVFYAPENVSLAEAKRVALEQARLQALAAEFGMLVSQVNTSVDKEMNGASESKFVSLSSTEVKGEWLEDKGEPEYQVEYGNGMLTVTCTVCGKAREIQGAKTELLVKVLRNGTDDRCESALFRSGDDLFLMFSSPVDGYLAVYLVDESPTAYCLLPYRKDGDGQQPVRHGHSYLFFSPSHAQAGEEVDEYTLTCGDGEEHNQIYVIFSPNPFTKALDSQQDEALPHELPYTAFNRWLGNCRKRDTGMEVVVKHITISERQ